MKVSVAEPQEGIAMDVNRRSLLLAALGLALPGSLTGIARAEEPYPVNEKDLTKVAFKYQRQEVAFKSAEPPGTIVVDARKCFLHLVTAPGQAIRYGVALGKGAHAWEGEVIIKKMKEWPTWIPAPYHVQTKPELAKWLPAGMPGGPDNPMGARAMYLFKGEVDTINRIHGGMRPDEIGKKKTAGCIGMLNADIIDLYARVSVGTRVLMTTKGGLFG
jgi:lipoprotein-anchoring transpeptidase ErfK/SrfK